MASWRISAITICVILFSLDGFGQDNPVLIYPTLIPVMHTRESIDLPEHNPFLILDVPVIRNNFYSEVRYNYAQFHTIAAYGGRLFSLGKKTNHVVTPQVGILFGDYKGMSLQFYYRFTHERLEINFQNHYGISFNKRPTYYFNWSGIQFPITKKMKIGNAVLIYSDNVSSTFDFSLFVVYKTGTWSTALYSFNFYDLRKHYFAVSIQKEIKL